VAANEWTINYLPEQGGRITGKLKLTDTDLEYTGLYDSSNTEIVKGIGGSLATFAVSGGHVSYFHDTGTDFGFTLPRADVDHAEMNKKGFEQEGLHETGRGPYEGRIDVHLRLRNAQPQEPHRSDQRLTHRHTDIRCQVSGKNPGLSPPLLEGPGAGSIVPVGPSM